jgi:hypothetical protein
MKNFLEHRNYSRKGYANFLENRSSHWTAWSAFVVAAKWRSRVAMFGKELLSRKKRNGC